MKWQAKMFQAMPKINQAYPTHRWLFLTLTVRNCDLTELRQTVVALNKGFERLTKRKNYPAVGWVRSIEVTRNPDTGKAHPHLHCLLLVDSKYFGGRNYITAKQWQEMWQSCMKLDYLPVINIKAVKPKLNKDTGIADDIGQAIVETLKYSVKESDLVADADWLAELTTQLHKTRAISIGGVLKQYLKDESDDDDLINIDDEQDVSIGDEIDKLYFGWRETIKRYKRIEC
jgi:plasmid rolling circle replication initiator protein Rep